MEIFGIGLPELLLIAVVALIFLGPERLPEAARTFGKGIADFRRTVEPARSAWRDLTSEITSVGTEVKNVVNTTAGAASSTIKPARKGEVTTAIPSENPWTVHPIMNNMTPEEREKFMAGGEIPPRIVAELSEQPEVSTNGRGYVPEVVDLDYPMPGTQATPRSLPAVMAEPEVIDYPTPGNQQTTSRPIEESKDE